MLHMINVHSLDKIGVPLRINSMSLNINERNSTASATLDDRDGMTVKNLQTQWFYDDSNPGKDMVWRAKSISTDYHTKTPTLQLEHVINTLKDTIMFNEVTPATITGKKDAKVCSAKKAIQYILDKQNVKDWKLSVFDDAYTTSEYEQEYSFAGTDTLYDALETVSSTLEECFWLMDTSVYPFRLKIVYGPYEDITDRLVMRPGRNITAISRTLDKNGMYTRFYPVGLNDLHLDGDGYVSKNTSYGIIEKTETDENITSKEGLKSWAKAMLSKHSKPVATTVVDGLDLSIATGESMDRLILGRICNIVLKDQGEMFSERIIGMSYPDKISQPEVVKITLSNKRDDVVKLMASDRKTSTKNSRVQARKSKETKQIILNTVKNVRVTGPADNKYTLQYQLVKDTEDKWNDGGNFSRAVTSWSATAKNGVITVTAHPQEQDKKINIRAGSTSLNGNVYSGKIQYSSDDGRSWSSTGAEYEVDATARYNAGWREAYIKVDLPKTEVTNRNYISVKTPKQTPGTVSPNVTIYSMQDYGNDYMDLITAISEQQSVTVARYHHGKYTAAWNKAYSKVSLPKETRTNVNYVSIGTPKSTVGSDTADTTIYSMQDYGNDYMDLITAISEQESVTVARYHHGKYTSAWNKAYSKVSLPKETRTNVNYVTIGTPKSTVGSDSADSTVYSMQDYGNDYMDLITAISEQESVTVARYHHGKYTAAWNKAYGKVSLPKETVTNRNYISIGTPKSTIGSDTADTTIYSMQDNGNDAVDLITAITEQDSVTVARYTHGKYTAAWNKAYGKVSLPKETVTNRNYITIGTPKSTVGSDSADSTVYSMVDNGNDTVDMITAITEQDSVVVARYTHGKYTAAWTKAYGKVSLPKETVTNRNYISIGTPKATVGSDSADTTIYSMVDNGNDAVDMITAINEYDSVVVARYTHGKYTAAWNKAYSKVSLPKETNVSRNYVPIGTPKDTVGSDSADTTIYSITDNDNDSVYLITAIDEHNSVAVAKYSHGKYTAAWNKAYGQIILPKETNISRNYISIQTPKAEVGGNSADTTIYSITDNDNDSVYLITAIDEHNSVAVAKYTHGKYTSGWNGAYSKVDLPLDANVSRNYITVKTPKSTPGSSSADSTVYSIVDNDNNSVTLITNVGGNSIAVAKYTHGKWDASRAAETAVYMYRGTYHEDSHLYECTCYVPYAIAFADNFNLYAR